MTKREFLTKVMEMVADEEMRAFAEEEIRKLDEALEKRKEKTSQKALENMPLLDKIYNDILKEDEPVTATVVGEIMEVSTQKASSLLRKLVEEGRANSEDIKVAKKGTQKGYTKRQSY